ncbi:MAG: cysteine-rich CWC family protein [Verrucomicrobiota bacterium]
MSRTQEEKHERKSCPRCGKDFTCMMNNIVYCKCSEVDVPVEVAHSIEIVYQDCLCYECLNELVTCYREKGFLDEDDLRRVSPESDSPVAK